MSNQYTCDWIGHTHSLITHHASPSPPRVHDRASIFLAAAAIPPRTRAQRERPGRSAALTAGGASDGVSRPARHTRVEQSRGNATGSDFCTRRTCKRSLLETLTVRDFAPPGALVVNPWQEPADAIEDISLSMSREGTQSSVTLAQASDTAAV